eukprot:4612860-Pleurochrysis_carterae.AAC.8
MVGQRWAQTDLSSIHLASRVDVRCIEVNWGTARVEKCLSRINEGLGDEGSACICSCARALQAAERASGPHKLCMGARRLSKARQKLFAV